MKRASSTVLACLLGAVSWPAMAQTPGATTVNVPAGTTVVLTPANRPATNATVTVASGGTLDIGANTFNVGTLGLNGTLAGTGSLIAGTYTFNGATANANTGTGALSQTGGTSLLNGTAGAGTVDINGGTLTLGASNRLADNAAVTIASGATLNIGAFTDTVGTVALSGTLAGTGTLTGATYALNGGTVTANLGAGTLTQTAGTSRLNGTSGAIAIDINGGTLALGASNRLADNAVVTISSDTTLNLGAFSDTVGTVEIDGTLAGTGTLTATSYTLNAATVTGNLGTGTLVQTGGTSTLTGTAGATTVNVNGGTLALGASNRLADAAAVNVATGTTLNLGAFSDTVSSVLLNGTLNGTGTLTATTYTLNAATVNANLGAGTLTQASDESTLVGTSAATRVNVNGGTLTLAASNRLADTAAVTVGTGDTLNLGTFTDTVGSLALSGTLDGTTSTTGSTGTLTAATYTLTGATVNANLGGGTLTQASGTSTLNGATAATSVNVNGGTLALAASNRLVDAAVVTVARNSTLNLGAFNDTVGSLALGGTLAGTGTLTAATYQLNAANVTANLGTGRLTQILGTSTLNGTVGATVVEVAVGTLSLGAADRINDSAVVQIANGATFNLSRFAETVATVTGTGTLSLGTGTLTIGRTNVNTTFDGTITGSGELLQAGNGTLVVTNDTSMTGRLATSAGTLQFSGTSAGGARIAGGRLVGTPTFTGTVTLASGTLAPGSASQPIATIGVGSLATTGGNYEVNFTGSAGGFTSDRVQATGAVTLGGTQGTQIVPITSDPSDTFGVVQTYTIIGGASVTGTLGNGATFAQVDGKTDLYWRTRQDLVPDTVLLEVRRVTDFTANVDPGATANQRAVAGGFNGATLTASDAYVRLLSALSTTAPADLLATYDSFSGEAITGVTSGVALQAMRFNDVVRRHLAGNGTLNNGDVGAAVAMIDGQPMGAALRTTQPLTDGVSTLAGDGGKRLSGWLQGFGANGQIDGRGGSASLGLFAAGVAGGAEVGLDNLTIGLAASVSTVENTIRARTSRSTGTLYQGGPYISYDNGASFVHLLGSYYNGTIGTRRSVFVRGELLGVATGDADTRGYTVSGGLGHRIGLGGGTFITPMVDGEMVRVTRDGYSERGINDVALTVARQTRKLYSGIGQLRLSHRVTTRGGIVEPYATAGARVNFGDLDTLSSMRFTGNPITAGNFIVEGARLAKTSVLAGAGIEARPTEKVSLAAGVGASIANTQKDYHASLQLKVGF